MRYAARVTRNRHRNAPPRLQLAATSALLPDVLPHQSRGQIDALLDSLRLTALQVDDDGIGAEVRFSVEPAGAAAAAGNELAVSRCLGGNLSGRAAGGG